MAAIRTKNRFGKRFIRIDELRNYAVDLNLSTHPPCKNFMEFAEREGLLTPVCRIQLPPEIPRRFAREEDTSRNIAGPVEPDGQRLDAAEELLNSINMNKWAMPHVYGEAAHPCDEPKEDQAQFIQSDFSIDTFVSWENRRVPLYETASGPVLSSERDMPSFYHYWQVFWLAAILRSGIHVYYPLDDEALFTEIWQSGISSDALSGRTSQYHNLEAYRELQELRQFETHFEAVGYYKAYSHNALQNYAMDRDEAGKIPPRQWRDYLSREAEIARDSLDRSGLSTSDIVEFIGKQCEWWGNACRVGPPAVAEEYKRNIGETINLLRNGYRINPQRIIDQVGRRTGHFKPTLRVIFPDWAEEQRELTTRSLKHWRDSEMASLPPPFPFSDRELEEFCDWLESKGLYQYYWHFRRLMDVERRDDPIHRSASTSEVVGFATLCEMIINEVLKEHGRAPRGKTLVPKLEMLFNSSGPANLTQFLSRYKNLRSTNNQSLPRRLAQIARIKSHRAISPVIRIMLSFIVIRNEGAHLGLLRFDHAKVIDMMRILSLASLMIWKAR